VDWYANNKHKQTAPASSAKAAEFTFQEQKKTLFRDANSKTQSSGVLIKMPGARKHKSKSRERTHQHYGLVIFSFNLSKSTKLAARRFFSRY
jgi:hypothetical protein